MKNRQAVTKTKSSKGLFQQLLAIKDRILLKLKIKKLKKEMAGTDSKSKTPDTAQKTITFEKMYRDGICKVSSNFYTKMVEFYDINYDLLEVEDQVAA